ncbi:MAG: helix-turn-helix domain-containing protein [Planctomycetaceae bacterium]|nr:helix-turn-helix domain-containing protein [Planctomycetaceae bacterium]
MASKKACLGRPKAELVLTDEEHAMLARWARRPKSSQQLALRSRIVLACGRGLSKTEVCRELDVAMPTVGKWRQGFVECRLEGLVDEPRPGLPARSPMQDVERVLA